MTDLRATLRLYALICMACVYLLLLIFIPACGVNIDNCEQQKDCRK